ncbi:hypothetical protein [Providencia sp. PROV150]|uniref:hypothetical protein n=1 Tax=Providencia sp. PROV150 TaxID=2949860 RepID=UPI00234B510B|nr:hypothetical protein [Providencia sp. PROV150]
MKINDVYFNRFNVPIVSSPQPYIASLIEDPVKIFVIVNYNWGIGHTGLVVGEGEDALLYDPSGGYSECPSKECYNNIEEYRTPRGSGEFFHYPEFNWDDYLSFQLWDGQDVQIIEFTVPREQAEKITELIYNYGTAGWAMYADTVFYVLKESGGIFNALEENKLFREDPWTFRDKLIELHYPKRGGILSGAY